MNLSDYINLTIKEIVSGAQEADRNLRHEQSGAVLSESHLEMNGIPCVTKLGINQKHNINKPIINIGFKVCVEAEEVVDAEGKISASIKIAKAAGEIKASESSRVSHEVTFTVPVLLPLLTKQTDTTSPSSQD